MSHAPGKTHTPSKDITLELLPSVAAAIRHANDIIRLSGKASEDGTFADNVHAREFGNDALKRAGAIKLLEKAMGAKALVEADKHISFANITDDASIALLKAIGAKQSSESYETAGGHKHAPANAGRWVINLDVKNFLNKLAKAVAKKLLADEGTNPSGHSGEALINTKSRKILAGMAQGWEH